MKTSAARASRGFTLVELMIVVVIAAILLAIAVPSFMMQVRQSRRVDAKTAVLDLAGREERYFSTSVTGANYSSNPPDLGYAGPFPITVGSGYYTLNVVVCGIGAGCGPNNIPGPSYVITALPIGGQTADTQCKSFIADSVGGQFVDPTSTQTAAYCWSN